MSGILRNRYYRDLFKEIVEKAIERGRVEGDRIIFQWKDIGNFKELKSKGVMKLCLKSNVLKVICRDRLGRKVYCIDWEVVSCIDDEGIVNKFIERIRRCDG